VVRAAGDALYENNFEAEEVGKIPAGFTIVDGTFAVREAGGNKFLELPGSPLDTYGFLFGPALKGDNSATARFFGTKEGRKFPTFGLSLNGVSGYRLQVSAAKKALEIFKGDDPKASVAFAWTPSVWTHLRLRVRKNGEGWIAEGRAWAEGTPEPAEWTIKFEDPETSSPGRAGIWGSPFAGTPILFDDLRIEGAP